MNLSKKEKFYTDKELLVKISTFCTYQERSHQEVRAKLYDFGLSKDKVEDFIVTLIQENFLSEERFAKLYAGGKFRIKKWGKRKIQEALKHKDISDYCIRLAMKEIPDADYLATLSAIIEKRGLMEIEKNTFKKNYKIAQYLISRGFESELVWETLNSKD